MRVIQKTQILNLALHSVGHPVIVERQTVHVITLIHHEKTYSLLLILRLEMNFMATRVPVKRCLPTVVKEEGQNIQLVLDG